MWHSCGLPCACRIEKYMREERPIQLEDIDVFWRKLNFQSCKLIDDSLDVVEELDVVRQQLQSHPPAQQKSLLSKIKAVLTPTKSTKKPPVVQQNTRGRPTTKQVQERLDEASRIDEELRRSSFGDANTCFEGHVIRGRAAGAALHPDVRARLDRLDDLKILLGILSK
ncbi:uncharacterized protein LOC110888914 [Helianthus annuus]|uniref:uncharacterized protein LOC110888914 n=1 Tax=Helianthus annuus TaxID=4232 RepID=UPI000B8F3D7D|nr:uncharacterized protein LOC110888914 [Helianthus annuus]